jgi:hypothetical protein
LYAHGGASAENTGLDDPLFAALPVRVPLVLGGGMTHDQQKPAGAETVLSRLKGYNPFVVGLDDRTGVRRYNFQLFDGETNLISLPIAEFDGYPIHIESRYIVSALCLVLVCAFIPLVPLLYPAISWVQAALLIGAYFIAEGVLYAFAAFRLTTIGATYRSANSDIMAANFVSRARGIKSIIHTFKIIVYWRRYLHYLMVVGYVCLLIAITIWIVKLHGAFPHLATADGNPLMAGVLLILCASSLLVFEVIRKKYTQGMDPTLALALMVEELGGQLLASRQTKIIGSGNE